mmetsp:Transcript_1381/g.3152  ORF Transcript_1381/g.3152 Transcript_1381/m.3152 type:complete len:200 (+) Transcript_1381:52-651(+)|eukprot:CAMPEP_0204909056 /NCGR_PEP_ID=MMETSP1397-20131031/7864_1 /ASSEMBLY_ACC=CAM_ASM_000891 /TAXON_ID=49980 /ORGANISM="Climacostomum Climacostomum virens, Strain Stock W-24" /LENGTH=199 /DNA_ID=CAMNT_0052078779 /DNA_START=28 /DNA_END=627 /DNA_ORIENTATION=-
MIGHTNSYIGSTLSLVSTADIRYLGRLIGVDTKNHTVTLADVKSLGTEGRRKAEDEVPSSPELHAYIVFRGADVKDLSVVEAIPKKQVVSKQFVGFRRRRDKPPKSDCLSAELTPEMRKEIESEFDFTALNLKVEEARPKEKSAAPGYNPSQSFYDKISYSGAKKPSRWARRDNNHGEGQTVSRGSRPIRRRYVRRTRP